MDSIDPRLAQITDCLYRVSIKAVIIHEGKLLMTQEKEGYYSLPGGGLDYGEQFETGLMREIEEELGVTAAELTLSIDQPLFMTTGSINKGVPVINAYYAVQLQRPATIKGSELNFAWFDTAGLVTAELSPSISQARDFLINLLST